MTKFTYVGVALLGVAAAGCAYEQRPYSYSQTGVYATDPSVGTTYSSTPAPDYREAREEKDRLLVEQVRQRLSGYGRLSDTCASLNLTANDGRVTIAGNVPNDEDRQMIKTLVKNTSGVSDVSDRMEIVAITPTGSSVETRTYPSDNNSGELSNSAANMFSLHVQGLTDTDRALAQRILQGLRTDTTISAILPSVNITVSGGRITLSGTVVNDRQRDVIDAAVERAAGVKEVDDRMRYTPRNASENP
jgi:osmotically-inducible protein OsmY